MPAQCSYTVVADAVGFGREPEVRTELVEQFTSNGRYCFTPLDNGIGLVHERVRNIEFRNCSGPQAGVTLVEYALKICAEEPVEVDWSGLVGGIDARGHDHSPCSVWGVGASRRSG
jgi:hypothetical protein